MSTSSEVSSSELAAKKMYRCPLTLELDKGLFCLLVLGDAAADEGQIASVPPRLRGGRWKQQLPKNTIAL